MHFVEPIFCAKNRESAGLISKGMVLAEHESCTIIKIINLPGDCYFGHSVGYVEQYYTIPFDIRPALSRIFAQKRAPQNAFPPGWNETTHHGN